MKISRASFLKSSVVALGAAFLEASPVLRWTTLFGSRRLSLDASLFKAHLNERFSISPPRGSRVPVVLARVTESPVTKGYEQFSLIFHGPAGTSLPDETYRLEHPALGSINLFIVAIGPKRTDRTTYQACFSRRPAADRGVRPA